MHDIKARSAGLGFTLVELLVVIGIIGTLIAILLPATAAIRRSANKLKTQSTFAAISAGLESYRSATGEPYPPSGSDAPAGSAASSLAARVQVYNPYVAPPTQQEMMSTGANLLLWALAGADLLSTPGFKDANRQGDGWWDDTHQISCCNPSTCGAHGLYALDDNSNAMCSDGTMEPRHKRFGPFIDISKSDITTMEDYAEDMLLPSNSPAQSIPMPPPAMGSWGSLDDYRQQRFILDGFGFPILYYRANIGASRMITDYCRDGSPSNPVQGVYDVVDNALYTGLSLCGDNLLPTAGMDLGAGKGHQLREADSPSPNPSVAGGDVLGNADFDNSLARFILNHKVTARNEPVKKDSYLLISPGPDALWGTEDDITNFD